MVQEVVEPVREMQGLPPGRYEACRLSEWKWEHRRHGSAHSYGAHTVRNGGHWQCEHHRGYRGQVQPIDEARRQLIAANFPHAIRVWEGPYGDHGQYEHGANEGMQRWMLMADGVIRVDHPLGLGAARLYGL